MRPWWLLVLLVGCFGSGGDAVDAPAPEDTSRTEPSIPTPPPQRLPTQAVRLPGDATAFEPNIAFHDGDIYVVAIGAPDSTPALTDSNVWLWRSDDAGATWETLNRPDGKAGHFTYDADIVSADGWLYVADWWIERDDDGQRHDQVMVSASPNGRDWLRTPAPLPPNTIIDREYLVAGDDGFVGLFYHRHIDGPNRIEAVFSNDRGVSWSSPVVVVPAQDDRFPIIAHPIMMDDGTLVLPYGHNHHEGLHLGARTDIRVAVSEDDGKTWEHRQFGFMPRGPGHLWPLQAAAAGERITLVWSRDDGPSNSIWTSSTSDLGRTWGLTQSLAQGGQHLMPWVASDGRDIIATWYDADAEGSSTKVPADTRWDIAAARLPAGQKAFWVGTAVKDVHRGPLCAFPTCNDATRLGDYPAVAAADGMAVFAYGEDKSGDVRVSTRVLAITELA